MTHFLGVAKTAAVGAYNTAQQCRLLTSLGVALAKLSGSLRQDLQSIKQNLASMLLTKCTDHQNTMNAVRLVGHTRSVGAYTARSRELQRTLLRLAQFTHTQRKATEEAWVAQTKQAANCCNGRGVPDPLEHPDQWLIDQWVGCQAAIDYITNELSCTMAYAAELAAHKGTSPSLELGRILTADQKYLQGVVDTLVEYNARHSPGQTRPGCTGGVECGHTRQRNAGLSGMSSCGRLFLPVGRGDPDTGGPPDR